MDNAHHKVGFVLFKLLFKNAAIESLLKTAKLKTIEWLSTFKTT